ncbi:biotin--[acetyl-CoA-carboxylase] ligase [Curtobacterium ammoniigenes]|uniref:biotin--[acetyl-CoA-carboxylase] ligase n=1 Tax=Curtobacterium ammoniigenes TaxID=395387 RepID=UPI0008306F7B|nr:biotin--[acetyl-CoA-carboxylase] ligase [Curtobacterium ammoniigenes]
MSSEPGTAVDRPSHDGFVRCAAAGIELRVVDRTGSTNADLLAVATETDHLAVLATLDQRAGRGRLDRTWVAPPGQTLAVSVLVRQSMATASGWLPLIAGAAMRDAIVAVVHPTRAVQLKWPNDVLIEGRKVSGILCQVAADGSVVVGAGVNLTIPRDALPTDASTSLSLEGAAPRASAGSAAGDGDGESAQELADRVLVRFHGALAAMVAALADGPGAADAVRTRVRDACGTLGQTVRVELPDGSDLVGQAVGIDDGGRLVVTDASSASGFTAVSAGDVTHLRYA